MKRLEKDPEGKDLRISHESYESFVMDGLQQLNWIFGVRT